ncbi:MAG: CDP-glycerol glycerophosphotransferase family protein [Clostridia bacterium]|nr:CDP-glycerol glycerophosphotransferase family protein [Clostridia bacterium]
MLKIKRILKRFLISLLPIRKIIIMESVPDFSDNTKAVYDEFIRRGVNKKYKIIWMVGQAFNNNVSEKNVKFLNIQSKRNRLKERYYNLVAKCLISCNRFLVSKRKQQFSMFLAHGTTLKSIRNYYNIPATINACLAAGNGVKELDAYEFNYNIEKIVALGFPRNDVLCKEENKSRILFGGVYDKVVAWYPTFRQHKSGLKTASSKSLPIIDNIKSAMRLNDVAKQKNILLVLKPHFAQDVSYIKDLNLSNLKLIDDDFFVRNEISSYEFISACAALISDYSSIYFDYILCDKPVAVIWEDIDEYKKNPGLIDNYEYYLKGAEKIYTLSDFCQFLERVSNGEDILSAERKEIRDKTNYSTDGKNSERVVDYILSQINYR